MKNAWKNKSQYDFYIKGHGRFLHAERLKYIKKIIRQIVKVQDGPKIYTAIDLGCGEGVLTTQIATDKLKIILTDYDLGRVLKAKSASTSDEKFIVSDILSPVFKKEVADIVILHHVIEHIEDVSRVLKNCFNLLSSEGFLILGHDFVKNQL